MKQPDISHLSGDNYTHHPPRPSRAKSHSVLTCMNIFFVSGLFFLLFFEIALGNLIS